MIHPLLNSVVVCFILYTQACSEPMSSSIEIADRFESSVAVTTLSNVGVKDYKIFSVTHLSSKICLFIIIWYTVLVMWFVTVSLTWLCQLPRMIAESPRLAFNDLAFKFFQTYLHLVLERLETISSFLSLLTPSDCYLVDSLSGSS